MVLVQVHTLHLDGEQYALCKWNPTSALFSDVSQSQVQRKNHNVFGG